MKNFKKSPISKLLLKEKMSKICLFIIIFLSAVNSFIYSKIVLINGEIINQIIYKPLGDIFFEFKKICIFSGLWVAFNIIYYFFMMRYIERLFSKLRKKAIKIVLNGKMASLKSETKSGNISNRLNSDIEKLSDLLTDKFIWFLKVLMAAVLALINCVILNYQLTIVFIIFPLAYFVIKRISKPIKKQKIKSARYIDKAMGILLESIHGLSIVKSFNLEKKITDKFNILIDKAVGENKKSEKRKLIVVALNHVIQILQMGILLGIGIFMIYTGKILPGNFISFLLLSYNIRYAVRILSDIAVDTHEASVLCERILETFKIPIEEKNEKSVNFQTDNKITLDIKNLTFKYKQKEILKDLFLNISHGKKIAIIGENGCGKSTLIKLVCGFYDDYIGQINIYQNDIKKISKEDLRNQISIVTQDTFIINGSVYENIVFGNKNVKKEEVIDIIEKCYLKHLIEKLPQGIDTIIGDGGVNLSPGEKQRISIARALVKNSPIVILDEATASLDYKAENYICKALENLLEGKTSLIITHKHNILKFADQIYLMENGSLSLM